MGPDRAVLVCLLMLEQTGTWMPCSHWECAGIHALTCSVGKRALFPNKVISNPDGGRFSMRRAGEMLLQPAQRSSALTGAMDAPGPDLACDFYV